MTEIVVFLVGTTGVVLGACLGASLLRLSSPLDWLTAAVLLAFAQVVIESIVVGGIFDSFGRWQLLIATLIWDAALVVAFLRIQPEAAGLSAVEAAALAAARGLDLWQKVIVVVAAGALLWRILLAVVLPPFAYDSLTYHLTAVANWVQTGKLGPNPYAACCARYPANAEVLFAWPTVLLGRDTLADVVQVAAAVLGALAVAGLARLVGVSAPGALTAAGLFVLTPIVLTQANTDYNDIVVGALFLTALYFTARLALTAARPDLSFALLSGLAAGLVLGTKTNGLVLAAAAVVPPLVLFGVRRRDRFWPVTGVILSALLAGAWWYARNWVQVGNPVAPFHVRVLGVTLFHGPASLHEYLTVPPGGSRNPLVEVARSWWSDLAWWSHSAYSYEERRGGLGPLWSWLGWASLTIVGIGWLRRRRDLAVAVLLPVILAFAALPYWWWSRFTMYLPALGAVAIVLLLERLRPGLLKRALALSVVALAVVGVALASRGVEPAGFGRHLSTRGVVSVALHPSRRHTVGNLFFSEYAWLDEVPRRATIGVEWEAPAIRFLYPLFGSRLQRQLLLYDNGQEAAVEDRLPTDGPPYLFVSVGGPYDRWLRRHPSLYRIISTARGTRAYRRLNGERQY
ncbi:MAG: hypothetical protein ACJ768_20730 [Gaiellaceae bacterium]